MMRHQILQRALANNDAEAMSLYCRYAVEMLVSSSWQRRITRATGQMVRYTMHNLL